MYNILILFSIIYIGLTQEQKEEQEQEQENNSNNNNNEPLNQTLVYVVVFILIIGMIYFIYNFYVCHKKKIDIGDDYNGVDIEIQNTNQKDNF